MSKKWFQFALFSLFLSISLPIYAVETRLKKVGEQADQVTYSGTFSKIKASGPFNFHLIPANSSKLKLECPPKIRSQVNVKIDNDTLHLRFKDGTFFNSGNQFICASIYFDHLNEIELTGSNRLTSEEPLKLSNLVVHKSGSGSIELDIDINKLILISRGSSSILLKGRSDELLLTALGSTVFDGSNFITQNAVVTGRGSSKITIHAKDNLKVLLSGNALLRYYGQPNLSLNRVAGQSRVEPAN